MESFEHNLKMENLARKCINDHRHPVVKVTLPLHKLFFTAKNDEEKALIKKHQNQFMAILEHQRVEKRSSRAQAIWRPDESVAQVTKVVKNLVKYFGYQNKDGLFLYPEEMLYLLETMEKFIIVKDYMKNCEGFGTTSRKVEFKLKPIPNNIEPVNWLKEAITQIVLKSTESLEPTDMVGFTFCSRNLERGKGWLRFQEASKVTVEEVWGVLNGIFQSNSSGIDTDTFCLEVTRVRLPKKKHGKEYFSLY